jgi:hypothetical protein
VQVLTFYFKNWRTFASGFDKEPIHFIRKRNKLKLKENDYEKDDDDCCHDGSYSCS